MRAGQGRFDRPHSPPSGECTAFPETPRQGDFPKGSDLRRSLPLGACLLQEALLCAPRGPRCEMPPLPDPPKSHSYQTRTSAVDGPRDVCRVGGGGGEGFHHVTWAPGIPFSSKCRFGNAHGPPLGGWPPSSFPTPPPRHLPPQTAPRDLGK